MSLPWKKRSLTSVLGLALGHDRFEAVELRRTNGSAEIRHSSGGRLDNDPFGDTPEAAGKQLRQQLLAAGIRETSCAVSLPPEVVLGLSLPVPDLPEADRESFLQIEAERGFPHDPDDLLLAHSVSDPVKGERHATLLAVPRAWMRSLETFLKAAHLKPVSVTPALALLQPASAEPASGTLALLPSGSGLALQVTAHRGVAGQRVVDNAFSPESSPAAFDADHVIREIRITVGQLPPAIRESLRRARFFDRSDSGRLAAERLTPALAALGIELEIVRTWTPSGLPFRLPPDTPPSAALAVATSALSGAPPPFQFLPPRVSAWRQVTQRYSSGRLAWAGAAVGALAGLVLVAFLVQQILLWRWESRWNAMRSQVKALEGIQKDIRLYRPWFDDSMRSLSILRRLTEAFPEDGTVTAKAIEIRAGNRVTCSGTASDNLAYLKMLDQLRNGRGIADVQVEQVRGKSPLEFTFNFRWEGPGGS